MKSTLTSICATGLLVALGTTQAASRYIVIDLGTLGGKYSYAYDLNNAGWVTGGSATASQTGGLAQTAFLWHHGEIINIGTLDGPACPTCNSGPGGPNASGKVILSSETSKMDPNGEDFCGYGTHRQCLAATWKNGMMTALPTLPGGHNAQAYGVNRQGQVIGFSENGIRDSSCITPSQVFRFDAVKWGPQGEIHKLPRLAGDTVAFAFGLNDNGQAVGASGLCSDTSFPPLGAPVGAHAVIWEKDGSISELDTLAGAERANATSINNRGDVVGNAVLSDGSGHAFLWTKLRGSQDLGTLPGDFVTVAPCCETLNNSRQVAGFSCPGPQGACRAFLWQNGALTDLNKLIPEHSPWYLLNATSINDAGEIVGIGTIRGEVHAFLAKPVSGSTDGR